MNFKLDQQVQVKISAKQEVKVELLPGSYQLK